MALPKSVWLQVVLQLDPRLTSCSSAGRNGFLGTFIMCLFMCLGPHAVISLLGHHTNSFQHSAAQLMCSCASNWITITEAVFICKFFNFKLNLQIVYTLHVILCMCGDIRCPYCCRALLYASEQKWQLPLIKAAVGC